MLSYDKACLAMSAFDRMKSRVNIMPIYSLREAASHLTRGTLKTKQGGMVFTKILVSNFERKSEQKKLMEQL